MRRCILILLVVAAGCLPDKEAAPPLDSTCVSRTGSNATVILPDTVAAQLEADTLRAYGLAGCVGEAAIPDSGAVSLTVWGDNTMTGDLDGLLSREHFTLIGDDTLAVALQAQIPPWLDLLEYYPNAVYVLR